HPGSRTPGVAVARPETAGRRSRSLTAWRPRRTPVPTLSPACSCTKSSCACCVRCRYSATASALPSPASLTGSVTSAWAQRWVAPPRARPRSSTAPAASSPERCRCDPLRQRAWCAPAPTLQSSARAACVHRPGPGILLCLSAEAAQKARERPPSRVDVVLFGAAALRPRNGWRVEPLRPPPLRPVGPGIGGGDRIARREGRAGFEDAPDVLGDVDAL